MYLSTVYKALRIMDLAGAAFSRFASLLTTWNAAGSSLLPCAWLDLSNALMAGMALRATLQRRTPWLRMLVLVWLSSLGGTLTVGLLSGERPPWLSRSDAIAAILIGWLAVFHCPGDIVARCLDTATARELVFPCLRAANAAIAMSRLTVERAYATWGGAAGAGAVTCVLLSFLGGCGGSLLIETLNLAQQPPATLEGLPSGAVFSSLAGALLYVLVLRPHALLVPPPAAATAGGLSAESATALLALFLLALHLLAPPRNLAAHAHAALDALPGWRAVWEPAGGNPAVAAPASAELTPPDALSTPRSLSMGAMMHKSSRARSRRRPSTSPARA